MRAGMKRIAIALSLLVIAGSLGVVLWTARATGPTISDDELMKFVAERAVPPLVKNAARTCRVPNPTDDRSVDLSVTLRTLAHGVELLDVRLASDGGPALSGADCLARALVRTRFEDSQLALPEGREYAIELTVPLPASNLPY
jgi:hypothetical protein